MAGMSAIEMSVSCESICEGLHALQRCVEDQYM
jgi:hypothetical protein